MTYFEFMAVVFADSLEVYRSMVFTSLGKSTYSLYLDKDSILVVTGFLFFRGKFIFNP